MKITCISDLHGYYPELPGGDLLIVAGDLTSRDGYKGYCDFNQWMIKNSRKYKKSIIIAGNHDNGLLPGKFNVELLPTVVYLCDSGTEFEGLKIWGSPWTKTFKGMNPKCKAFTCETEEELAEKWGKFPFELDILITHSPPYGILDQVASVPGVTRDLKSVGSTSLKNMIDFVKPRLHLFGHIHECAGWQYIRQNGIHDTLCINASHVNEYYKPVNSPITIEI